MIKADCSAGELMCRGPIDSILSEYTLLTQLMLKQIEEIKGEETAFTVLAKLGQLAADGYKDNSDLDKIYKGVDKVIADEMQI